MKIHGLRAIRTSPAEVSLESGPGEISGYLGFPLAQKYRCSCQEGVAFPWDDISSSLGYGLLEKGVHLLGFDRLHTLRQWHPTPVPLSGESQGHGSLVGCHLWGRTESDTTEAT